MRIVVSVLFILAAGVLPSGCGKSRTGGSENNSSISGKVTYKGEALGGGIMLFHGKDRAFPAALQPDGSYVCDLPSGDYVVTIDTTSLKDSDPAAMMKKMGKGGPGTTTLSTAEKDYAKMKEKSKATLPRYVAIPGKYADKKTSGLPAKVDAGSNTKDFQLAE